MDGGLLREQHFYSCLGKDEKETLVGAAVPLGDVSVGLESLIDTARAIANRLPFWWSFHVLWCHQIASHSWSRFPIILRLSSMSSTARNKRLQFH